MVGGVGPNSVIFRGMVVNVITIRGVAFNGITVRTWFKILSQSGAVPLNHHRE